jgi:nitrite reductase (NO-forming)
MDVAGGLRGIFFVLAVEAACGHPASGSGHGDSLPNGGRIEAAREAAPPSKDEPCRSLPVRSDSPGEDSPAKQDPAEAGFQVFSHTCVTCHQPSGRGMPGAFPPLAGSDFLMADKKRSIDIVLAGLSAPIMVNDRPYSASMPSHACLSDNEVANVLTYVRSSWGNDGAPVTRDEVAARRERPLAPR